MKSKKLFPSVSTYIVLEDFKKYLFVSLLGLVYYILIFIGPLLMEYKKLQTYDFAMDSFLFLRDVNARFIICVLALVSASLVFKYLQNRKESIYIHSLPFTRKQLFISKFAAGFIIGIMPIFITWIILHIMSKPVLVKNYENIFSHERINMWLIGSFLYFLIIYSITVFSCIISGNLLMQLVSAIGIGFIPYAIYRCSTILYLLMIKGASIDFNDKLYTFLKTSVPLNLDESILENFRFGSDNFIITVFLYIIFSVLLIYSAYLMYNRRKLEKIGDMIVFSGIAEGLLYIGVYCGSILLPVLGQELFFGRIFFTMTKMDYVLLFLILSIICFVVGALIIYKTIKIFEKTSKKNAVIFLITYAVLLLSLSFDVLKIEQKTPDLEDIDYIESDIFQTIDTFIKPDIEDKRFDNILFGNYESISGETIFKEKENIKAIRAAHKDVIKDLPYYNIFFADFGYGFSYFKEGEKDRRILKRVYMPYEKNFRNNKNLKQVFESEEFKDKYRFNSIKGNIDYIKVSMIHFIKEQKTESSNDLKIYDCRELKELINNLDSDLKDMSYESFLNRKNPICSLKIGISNDITSLGEKEIFVYPEDKHILELLESKSYLNKIKVEPDNIEKIVIKKVRLSEVSKDFNSIMSRWIKEDWTILEVYEPHKIESLYKFFDVEEIDNGYSLSVDLEIYFKERDMKVTGTIYCPLKKAPKFLKETVDTIKE